MADKRAQATVPELKKHTGKLSDCASGMYAYKLPRSGTTIEIWTQSDCVPGKSVLLWKLKFNGETFDLAE